MDMPSMDYYPGADGHADGLNTDTNPSPYYLLTVNQAVNSRTTSRAAAWRNAAGQAGRGPPRVVVAEKRFTFHRRQDGRFGSVCDVPERPAITRQISRPLMNVHVST